MSQEPENTPPAPTRSLFFKAPLDATTDIEPQETSGEAAQTQDDDPGTDDSVQQPDRLDNKNDPKRFEYWQSQAAKAQNQLKELSEQLDQYKSAPKEALELAQTLYKHPELLDILEKAQTGELQKQVAKPAKPAKERYAELKKPAAPQKPADYNEYDAQNDPDSESYKYREASLQHKEKLSEYLLQREELREEMEAEEANERLQRQREQEQFQEIANELEHKHGLNQAEIKEFFEVFSNPNPSTEQLVRMYRGLKGPVKPVPIVPKQPAPAPTKQETAGGQKPQGSFFGVK